MFLCQFYFFEDALIQCEEQLLQLQTPDFLFLIFLYSINAAMQQIIADTIISIITIITSLKNLYKKSADIINYKRSHPS